MSAPAALSFLLFSKIIKIIKEANMAKDMMTPVVWQTAGLCFSNSDSTKK